MNCGYSHTRLRTMGLFIYAAIPNFLAQFSSFDRCYIYLNQLHILNTLSFTLIY